MVNFNNYKVAILTGGKGSRFFLETHEISKSLLIVKRKLIISYLADLFIKLAK